MGSDDKNNNSDSHNTVLYIQMGACVILIASRYALHLLGEHQAMADVIVGGGILAKDIYANFLYKAEESDKKAGDAFTKKYKKEVVGLIKAAGANKTNLDSLIILMNNSDELNEEALKKVIDGDTDDEKAAREVVKTLIENLRSLRKKMGDDDDAERQRTVIDHYNIKILNELKDEATSMKAVFEKILNEIKENKGKDKNPLKSGDGKMTNDEYEKAAKGATKVLEEWITQQSNQGRSAQAFRSEWQDIVAMLLNVAVLGSGALDLAKVQPFHQSGKGRSRSRRQRGGKKRSRSSRRSRSQSRRRRRSNKH